MTFPRAGLTRAPILIAGVIVAASTMSACASQHTTTGTVRDELRLDRPTDATITTWAETGLRLDPRISPSDITVTTLHGIVKLSGTVDSVGARDYAKLEVQKIDGVRGVIDELIVRPADRLDTEIQSDVVARLTHSPGVRCKDLAVVVTNGTVTLHGRVADWNERQYATTLAGEVRGVRDVTNEMELSFLRPLTDPQNRDEIVAAIDRDPYLTGLPITVRVSDGVATLEGTVGNAYEKDRAENDAFRVGSIASVDNLLAVDWFEERGVREGRPTMTDDRIRSAVRDSLDQDLRIRAPGEITIRVTDRVVTLEGSAPDFYQVSVARQDARDVVGVEDVVDLIDINAAIRDDEAIAGQLRHSLKADHALAERAIGVIVDDGIVTLTGEVHSPYEREHAEYVATSVAGVRGVVNDVIVQPAVGYSDEALKERIEGRLAVNWKTRPVAPRIHVLVEDGSATLTGDVDSWSERVEAARVARVVDGVTDVTNDLTLESAEYPAVSRLIPGNDDGGR